MDRNTLIGLGLIGVILATFTFYNKPSQEEMLAKRAEQEKILNDLKNEGDKSKSDQSITLSDESQINDIEKDSLTPELRELDSLRNLVSQNNLAKQPEIVKEEEFQLENDKIQISFTNLGGGVKSVRLKEHQTFTDYIANRETGEVTPLLLFDEESAVNKLSFKIDNREVQTKDLVFTLDRVTENYLALRANLGNNKAVEQIYTLVPGEYHVNYEIQFIGFDGSIAQEDILLDWEVNFFKSERLLSEQRRIATIFLKETEGSYDYLSETSDDEEVIKKDLDWVAFKQGYFSSIIMPTNTIKPQGTLLKVGSYGKTDPRDSTHVKPFAASINLGAVDRDNALEMKWYFGPTDYELLKSYNNGAEDLLNYGWGLFRWINVYAIQPIFNWLATYGINFGIVILILTVIIKLVLTPIQWKMYASSAKMRILKPEIDEINAKYPDKEQAMEKQMEMMTLYRESGASPLAGCIPMLIQMPILVAVFRFFPSTFALRQQPFLWAEDLSSFDSILDFGFNIPLYGDHISLFTLLMAGTTLIYTIFNSANQMQQPSQPGMPNMKVIMYIFPIMMIFFFNNYASGLSYYYFVSTLMSILTMVAIKNFFVDEEKLKAKMAAKKEANQENGKKRKKSKFQERLEEMQKLQQERAKMQKKK